MNTQSQPLNMPCLTVLQPWAELIASGRKRIENRTWPTRVRSPWLLIHAGKGQGLMPHVAELRRNGVAVPDTMAFGAIVAICTLVDCVHIQQLKSGKVIVHETQYLFAEGPWCWLLADVRRFPTPIPYRGAQGLFQVPASVVADQLKSVRKETA